MAAQDFEHFLTSLPKDSSLRDEIKNIREILKSNIDLISERLIEEGATPSHGTGLLGSISNITQNMRKMAGESELDILKDAVSSLKMLISDGEKVLEEIDDGDIIDFFNYIFDRDRLNLMVLERTLTKQLAFV